MGRQNDSPGRNGAPEPPERWKPDAPLHDGGDNAAADAERQHTATGTIASTHVELSGDEIAAFESARRLITISQVAAVVSFIIGGVALSTVALICAAIAYRQLSAIAMAKAEHPEMQSALRRVGFMALALSAVALAVNAIALALLYPVVMDAVQSGGFGSVFGGSGHTGGGSGNSTWG